MSEEKENNQDAGTEVEIATEAEAAPKSLHELNLEQQAIDQSMREINEQAANAASKAVFGVLNKHRPDGKRTQKVLRPPINV